MNEGFYGKWQIWMVSAYETIILLGNVIIKRDCVQFDPWLKIYYTQNKTSISFCLYLEAFFQGKFEPGLSYHKKNLPYALKIIRLGILWGYLL